MESDGFKRVGRDLARLWRESYGTRGLALCTAAAGCLNVAVALMFIWATKRIVDFAVGPAHTIPSGYVALLVACLLLQLLIPALRRRLETAAFIRYSNTMRSRLLGHLLGARWSGRGGMHHGDAISRMRDDVDTLASLSCSTIPGLVAVAMQLAGAFVFLAMLEARLAIAVVFIMPVALVVSKIYVKKTRRVAGEIRRQESAVQTFLQESLSHRTLLSTLMAGARRVGDFDTMQASLAGRIMERTGISIYSNAVISAGFMAGYAVTFLWSAYGLAAGLVSFGMMTAFLQLVAQVQRPVLDLSRRIPAFINASVALDRIDGILAIPLEDYTAPHAAAGTPAGLCFDSVSYRYPDGDHTVICGLSHDFRPGSVTAVTGPTGSGKSTLLRLMLGLVEPVSGAARFYTATGESGPISAALRRNIVYVPQGNTLVCGTVRDNLRLANPDATDQEMALALKAAVADFVLELPDGLDTQCFEGGGGFSEGQAQRIAIARGLLRKGSVILLDEPTSALDPETELQFLSRFLGYVASESTIIIVTHRPAVLSYCTDVLEIQPSL